MKTIRAFGLIGTAWLAGAATTAAMAAPAEREFDLAVLGDFNGNSSAELATLVSEPVGDGELGAFGSYPRVYVRDSATGVRINSFRLFERDWVNLEFIAVPYGSGKLIGALQQHVGGAIRVALYDAATGALIRNIGYFDTSRTAIAATFVRDAAGPGAPGLAVLAANLPIDGRRHSWMAGEEVMVEVRELDTGAYLQTLYNLYYPKWDYGYDVTPLAIAAVDDQNGNGSSELAALARVGSPINTSTLSVVTRDAYSAEYLSPYNEGNGEATMVYTNTKRPLGFVSLPDVNDDGKAELAVFGPGHNGYRLQLRGVSDGALAGNRRILVDWSSWHLRALGDVDGNGAAEIALAALRADGRIAVQVRDGASLTITRRIRYLTAGYYELLDLEVMPDQSGNGIEELAVIGRDPESGNVRIQIRDAQTGERLRTFALP